MTLSTMLWRLDADGAPVQEPDVVKWGEWFEAADRTIACDRIGHALVSTVFVGVNSAPFSEMRGGAPTLYETMIFGGARHQEREGYATRDEALAGHKRMVGMLKNEEEAP